MPLSVGGLGASAAFLTLRTILSVQCDHFGWIVLINGIAHDNPLGLKIDFNYYQLGWRFYQPLAARVRCARIWSAI